MNRTAPEQTQVYEFFAWALTEILKDFIRLGVHLCIQVMHWNPSLCKKLQQITIQHFVTILQSGS